MTSIEVLRPRFLLLLLLVPVAWAAWRRWRPPLPRRRARLALGLRIAMLVLLVLALADTRVARAPRQRAVIAVVDLSDSARASRDDARAAVDALVAAKGADDLFGVVTFGRDAQVEVPPSREPEFRGFQTTPDGTFSNLDGALQLAGNLIPDGYARQVVLLSDGRQNLGDAARAVTTLRDRSVRVDVLPLGRVPGPEVLVASLEAPNELREGEALRVTARLRSSTAAKGRLDFQVDGRVVESREVDIPAGDSMQLLTLAPLPPGTHRLRALVHSEPDGYSQNDAAEAVVRVLGRPSVLVLEGTTGAGGNVRAGLEAAGMTVESRRAAEAPADAAALARYDAVVVVDAPAHDFPPGALAAIAAAVRDLGHGLVAIGGPRAYGPGGWKDTPLEEALPVRMELPRPKERPAIALAVGLETMEHPFGDVVALGAAGHAIDQLTPEDEVTVVNLSSSDGNGGPTGRAELIVPLTRATDREAIKQAIGTSVLGDPPGYAQPIGVMLDSLSQSTAATKHLIVVGDGDAIGGKPEYDAMFARARSLGVVVSAIGVGTHFSPVDMAHMRDIAERGGGIFYESASAEEVPDILLEATRTSMRPWFEQTPFFPEVTSAGGLLDGIPLDAFPQLGGYVATTAKPTADVALASPGRDPVLASGRYGLGRSVAWTSDAVGRWTGGFLSSPVSATLFGRMVAWTLPPGGRGDLRVDAAPQGDGLRITVTGEQAPGDLRLTVIDPDGATGTSDLRPEGLGRWDGVVPAASLGTYVVHAVLQRDGVEVAASDLTVSVPYSPEFLELGRDDGLLRQLAAVDGAVLDRPGSAWSVRSLPLTVSSRAFWLLLLLFVVLWPVDVALRRLTLSPLRILGLARAAGAAQRRAATALPDHVATLRRTMDARRRRDGDDLPVVVEASPSPPDQPARDGAILSRRLLAARRARDEERGAATGDDGGSAHAP